MAANPDAPSRAKIYCALLIPSAVVPMDFTIVNVVLPSLVKAIHASTSDLQWIVITNALAYIAVMLIASNAGDRYGRRRVLEWGLVVFAAGAVCAASSQSPLVLILSRAVMGIGSAMITPMSLSLLQHSAKDAAELARSIRVWGAVAGLSMVAGPVIGGVLLATTNWRVVFLFDVPQVLFSLVAVRLWVRESRDPVARRSDVVGSALSAVGLFAAMWAIIEAPTIGWSAGQVVLAFGVGVLGTGLFVAWERRTSDPMVDFSLTADRAYTIPLLCILATNLPVSAALFMSTQFYRFGAGWGALASGLGLAPLAASMAWTSWAGSSLAVRFGLRRIVAAGLLLQGLGYLITALVSGHGPTWLVAATLGVSGAGMGLVYVPAVNAVVGATPPDRAGVGAGLQHMLRQVSGALGVAVVGGVFVTVFRSRLTTAIGEPSGPADRRVLDAARHSAGAAVSQASGDDRLISLTSGSIAHGFAVALLVCAGTALLGAVGAALALPSTLREPAEPVTTEAAATLPRPVI